VCPCTIVRRRVVQEELLTFEAGFSRAVALNDVAEIGRFVADDWVIVDADGSVIDRSRFISVIESGALTHDSMESTDVEVRVHGDTAVVTESRRARDTSWDRDLPRGSARPMSSHD
jgi:ketosteroid isomerase-like protein